ncbi:hypothetical protein ASZ90_007106 [hydrocarbon metagenome]|uniref:Uncharacterized protein n=1 Tax=hydrocarbon metagenome TaxID=938273 RepID=A0A0W8FQB7_9ZZZZ
MGTNNIDIKKAGFETGLFNLLESSHSSLHKNSSFCLLCHS